MNPEITITTEHIDDFPLLLKTMMRLGLAEILDRYLNRHGLHQGLSWGWIATIWLAHILSQGDHRKLPVQTWVRKAQETIERLIDEGFPPPCTRHPIRLGLLSIPAKWRG